MNHIGIWNTAFLGDAVLTLPLIQTLHAAFPEAAIDFYVRRGFGQLFAAQPQLRAVYEYDKTQGNWLRRIGSILNQGNLLAQRNYDLWIGAHSSFRSAVLAYLSRASVRGGYSGNLVRHFCYTYRVARRFGERHEIERLLALVHPVLPPEAPLFHWPNLALSPPAQIRAQSFRETLFTTHNGPLLGLHPGSVWGTKRWLPLGFAEIARRAAALGAHVLLFGGPGEHETAQEVAALSGLKGTPRFHDFSGKLSLPELAAFLGVLDCYVTNDSGPMHIAWAQHTPVTALFGPTVQKFGFFPRGESADVFEVSLACRPCGLHGPRICPQGHHRCMAEIDVNAVWDNVSRKLLRRRPPQKVSARDSA